MDAAVRPYARSVEWRKLPEDWRDEWRKARETRVVLLGLAVVIAIGVIILIIATIVS
jgi:hypothetical protein